MCCFQAECDELAQRADVLKEENASLRLEVNRIRSEYEQLLSENAALKVMLKSCLLLLLEGMKSKKKGTYGRGVTSPGLNPGLETSFFGKSSGVVIIHTTFDCRFG